jgi:hypothetical protein
LWVASLALRALLAASMALYLIVAFPRTAVFRDLAHWCQHTALPGVGFHVDVHGHTVIGALVAVPAVSMLSMLVVSLARGGHDYRVAHRLLRSGRVGSGPGGSVVIGGLDVVFAAAAGLPSRIIVSIGALTRLDDDELAAALAHERAHIARRHHLILAFAELCYALARLLPGTRTASSELRFHLERDADAWALRHDHDRLALASAICKAATAQPGLAPGFASLEGGRIDRRLAELLDPEQGAPGRIRRRLLDLVAVVAAGVVLASVVTLPAEAVAGEGGTVAAHGHHHCVG